MPKSAQRNKYDSPIATMNVWTSMLYKRGSEYKTQHEAAELIDVRQPRDKHCIANGD